jgi:hypothetical protein
MDFNSAAGAVADLDDDYYEYDEEYFHSEGAYADFDDFYDV